MHILPRRICLYDVPQEFEDDMGEDMSSQDPVPRWFTSILGTLKHSLGLLQPLIKVCSVLRAAFFGQAPTCPWKRWCRR